MQLLLHNYEDELSRIAESAKEIKVAIAFLTEGGIGWLPEDSAKNSEFIVGIDLGITTPDALKALQARGASLRVFREPGKLFHPKAVYLRNAEGEFLIVGSNNLTSGGIASNHELSLLVRRDNESEAVFGDFLAYFDSLKAHECCGIPDDSFYATYEPSPLRMTLSKTLEEQPRFALRNSSGPTADILSSRIRTLGDFIRLVAQEFPKLERRIDGTVKDHPLKTLNDEEFLPLFEEIVSAVSGNRMKGHSQLNIGGQWYRIPNILAVNEDREPWENTSSRGRLIFQIHFTDDYQVVFFSVVLQYNLHRSIDAGEMPTAVAKRFEKLHQHVENYSSKGELGLPVFRHWNYKDTVLWGQPLLSFRYRLDALPEDEILVKDLEFLANVVNGASAVT